MNRTIYQVDAFTDVPFKGNPAGVMFCDDTLSTEFMQQMAMEMNLSETAFVIPDGDHLRIRYFTPLKEVPLCGHATLATGHMIYELGLKGPEETCLLKAKGADLTISREDGWITMNFPAYPLNRINAPAGFKEIIGFEPIEVYTSSYDWIVAVARSEEEIASACPDFGSMVEKGLGHLIITAASDQNDIDFVTRCFAPLMGIDEDPVTGSAHCALTPLWSHKLGKTEMNSLQLSSRTGRLKVKVLDNNRIGISGQAVTIFEGKMM